MRGRRRGGRFGVGVWVCWIVVCCGVLSMVVVVIVFQVWIMSGGGGAVMCVRTDIGMASFGREEETCFR